MFLTDDKIMKRRTKLEKLQEEVLAILKLPKLVLKPEELDRHWDKMEERLNQRRAIATENQKKNQSRKFSFCI